MAVAGTPQEQARKAGIKEGAGRALAQGSALAGGVALIAIGVLGFVFAGQDFGIGQALSNQDLSVLEVKGWSNVTHLSVLEVNGWSNVLHLVTGVFLALMSVTGRAAVSGLFIVGLVYLAITVVGFLDGSDVLNVIPVNPADNMLYAVLAGLALVIALVSGGLLRSALRTQPPDTR
ncbi:MAG: DUF4383 domain-containing protein [Actinobacteria bacterium]|nr:DUF4383 domain-containing protein [Actinomycetota bacterium]